MCKLKTLSHKQVLYLIGRGKFSFEVLEVLEFLYPLRHLHSQESPALPL